MRFLLRQKRAMIGHTITVKVTAGTTEEIKRATNTEGDTKVASLRWNDVV